jgi:hypothetical protein
MIATLSELDAPSHLIFVGKYTYFVIPANAGTHLLIDRLDPPSELGSRVRGNDDAILQVRSNPLKPVLSRVEGRGL